MMSAVVLACVYMLPALVAADVFYFGGCDANFDSQLDPKSLTQEGINILNAFTAAGAAQLYLWNPTNVEKDFRSWRFSLTGSTFTLSYITPSEASVSVSGQSTYATSPKGVLQLDTKTGSRDFLEVFSFNDRGIADLYPLHISKTDIILRGCNGAFLGRRETLYVFTNQNYTPLDKACAVETIRTMTGWTVFAANN